MHTDALAHVGRAALLLLQVPWARVQVTGGGGVLGAISAQCLVLGWDLRAIFKYPLWSLLYLTIFLNLVNAFLCVFFSYKTVMLPNISVPRFFQPSYPQATL